MSIADSNRYYLKLKALYYFYKKGYTQTDIAKLLNISRVTLGKLLEEARAEGMVKIEIVDVRNMLQLLQTEDELKRRFHLRDVVLVDGGVLSDEEVVQKIASEAAAYLEQVLRSGMKIGVTWGRTLNMMVNRLSINHAIRDLTVYTLVGSTSSSLNFQPNVLAQNLLHKYSGTSRILTAPFMCHSSRLCAEIKKEPQISQLLQESRDLDLTLVGIGEAPAAGSARLSDYPFDAEMIAELVNSGAIGDICGNFFDINGRLCETSLQKRIVSIDIRDLPHHRMVVGIGGGERKAQSILGALNGSYLDVLITDLQTASAILRTSTAG